MNNLENQINWLLQEKYSDKLTNKAKKDIEKLRAGEPIDYIIGFIDFLDCKIDLSKKTLIPRVETEYWVDRLINEDLKLKNCNLKVLDMFAGSGAIGVAILKSIPLAQVVFIDSEKNCLEQIKINCKINKIPKNRYKIIKSDVFSALGGSASGGKNLKSKILNLKSSKFDYIIANPPYIPIERIKKIQKSVLKYEPHIALFGGEDGLFYINKFLIEAKNFINPGGKVYMEFDSLQKKSIEKLLKKLNYKNFYFQKDQYNKWRSLIINI